jgi:hypothetical protein
MAQDERPDGPAGDDEPGRRDPTAPGGEEPGGGGRRDQTDAGERGASSAREAEEERLRAALDQLKRVRVASLVEELLVGLVTVGYQKLGLTEKTRELRDLGEARLAIETIRASLDVLARERAVEGLTDLRNTLAAMQLEYARVSSEAEASGERASGPETSGERASGPETSDERASGPEASGA